MPGINYFRGDAQAVAQTDFITIGGTLTLTNTVTVTMNRKICVVPIDGTMATVNDVASALATALQNMTASEFKEVLWTYDTTQPTKVFATAETAGIPYLFTTSVTGTITAAKTVGIASAGPEHYDVATNWSAGNIPVNSDIVIFPATAGPCRYGLDQGIAVTPASLAIYSKVVGLPDNTGDSAAGGYIEYRNKSLKYAACATVTIGDPDQDAADLIRVYVDSVTGTTFTVNQGGGVVTDAASGPPVKVTTNNGAGAGHTLRLLSGSVGLAPSIGDVCRFADVYVGTYNAIEGSVGANDEDCGLYVGPAAIVSGTAYQQSGSVRADVAVPTISLKNGVWSQRVGVPTTLNAYSGSVFDLRGAVAGTITTANFYGARFDMTGSAAPVTVTNLLAISAANGPSMVSDPHKRLFQGSTTNMDFDRASIAASDLGERLKVTQTL